MTCNRSSGFTLIEVVAALVIFAGGVLVVLQLSGTLATQMERAAVTSEIVVVAQQRLDSLETVPFASLTPGSSTTPLMVRGRSYFVRSTVTSVTAILRQIDVEVAPNGGPGPTHQLTGYSVDNW